MKMEMESEITANRRDLKRPHPADESIENERFSKRLGLLTLGKAETAMK